ASRRLLLRPPKPAAALPGPASVLPGRAPPASGVPPGHVAVPPGSAGRPRAGPAAGGSLTPGPAARRAAAGAVMTAARP
ncbi:hypothetical protein ACFCYM_31645, partial [Streptomyces sp. NPDC056254]